MKAKQNKNKAAKRLVKKSTRFKGKRHSETQTYNHPRKDFHAPE